MVAAPRSVVEAQLNGRTHQTAHPHTHPHTPPQTAHPHTHPHTPPQTAHPYGIAADRAPHGRGPRTATDTAPVAGG